MQHRTILSIALECRPCTKWPALAEVCTVGVLLVTSFKKSAGKDANTARWL